ncbi:MULTISPECIES: hypothetical protein [unclassified Crossiella]|uniref:hypothetical protein n=1 Tax=unclassified Crossiella TaxID=2620835 RepID=UPI00207C9EE3|nr:MULTISPECIES: hypothetical protein [unclassified Crossiella]MCO1582142.1 hypothetical protein [Crossiella sp. SN42]WHT20260.1 hypothetical protein N8J89_04085 [Crossiella sp. CA-258035]
MSSRTARAGQRVVTTLVAVPATGLLASGVASAGETAQAAVATVGTTGLVPIVAVALGVGGMVAGVVRGLRGQTKVDPANERINP